MPPSTPRQQDAVVVLHGLFATRKSMRQAAAGLRQAGYLVHNWGYRTFGTPLEASARALLPVLRGLDECGSVRSVNFLTHSMGGILARRVMGLTRIRKLRRMVMLAPPNSGSPLTRIPLGPFAHCVPALADLARGDALPEGRCAGDDRVEVGILAASSDFIVRVQDTYWSRQRELRVVRTNHFRLPAEPEVIRMAVRFLDTGSFAPAARGPISRAA
jgi:hypothetical protein